MVIDEKKNMIDKRTKIFLDYYFGSEKTKVSQNIIDGAQKNRVLYDFSKKYELEEINDLGEEWILKLSNTLKIINKTLDKKLFYLVTRTYKYVEYITFDVDLYVKSSDFEKTIEIFKKNDFKSFSHDNSLGGRIINYQKNLIKDNLLTIDLHKNFTWQKRFFFDIELIHQNIRIREIAGVKVAIPSAEIEFMLCMADISHERFNITLLDIIWLMNLSKEITGWNGMYSQAKKHGWEKTYIHLSKIINAFTEEVYGKKIIPGMESVKSNYSLPYFLPLRLCYKSYWENFIHTKNFPLTSFAYMHYCKIRYYLSNKKKMPYYDNWYNKG